ncbi:uncharacterized protein LOC114438537 isoform X1 [Parambassis ranga]|uniref:Uncharacterized protein LOC114438537 isoform X1 n=1 Tax=Parambassis ranga TaxID=210632 RepID=A0A6P7IQQ0_9TELE|nr:uncharacterized protein LOC114438537 isoform X1 [Parambassis ranga]
MKISRSLSCFFFLSLQHGNSGRVGAEIYTGVEGGNISVPCQFPSLGRRLFCKERCEEGNILVDTYHQTAQSGRYSIRHGSTGSAALYVSITELKESDSGLYTCGSRRFFSLLDTYQSFQIIVRASGSGSVVSVGVGVTVALLVLLSAVVLAFVYKNKADCLTWRRRNKAESVVHENSSPVSICDDSTYQSLHLASGEQGETYSTITCTVRTMKMSAKEGRALQNVYI